MTGLVSLVSRALTLNVQDTLRNTRRNTILIAFATLMFLSTYTFLMIAALIWLAARYGIMPAVLILAGITVVLGLIAILIMIAARADAERRRRERREAIEAITLPLITSSLVLIRKRPLMALSVALAILTATQRSSGDDKRNRT